MWTPAEAMAKALEYKRACWEGREPVKRDSRKPTFRRCLAKVLDATAPGWKRAAIRRTQWEGVCQRHGTRFLQKPIDKITVADIEAAVLAIWHTKHPTAAHLLRVVNKVMDHAVAHGYRTDNPARTVQGILPRVKAVQKHRESVGYENVADAIRTVDASRSMLASKLLFRFICMTGVRSREAAEAGWSEFDLSARCWTIPSSRMKTGGKPFRVPLSSGAIDVLRDARELGEGELVFPSMRGRAIGSTTLMAMMHKLEIPGTVHGMRNCLADWITDCTDVTREVREMCLAHETGNQTERSYVRTDHYERRREVMEMWSRYLSADNVVAIRQTA